MKLCECGCNKEIGDFDKYGRPHRFAHGHNPMPKGENSPYWKGGKTLRGGYRLQRVYEDKQRYHKEHRVIMEKHLGRKLTKDEIVHHKNGNKLDNRIENLEVMTWNEHTKHHKLWLNSHKYYNIGRENWLCVVCDKKTYLDKKGKPRWFKHPNGHLCMNCYNKQLSQKRR